MNTILTDDERREILDSFPLHPWGIGSTRRDAELIVAKTEAAVLAKLREQEPVGLRDLLMEVVCLTDRPDLQLQASELLAAPLPAVVQVPQGDEDSALDFLAELFDAYENGPACYEDPDDCSGFLGNAVRLDSDTFHAIADLLNRRRPVSKAAAPEAPAQGDPLEKLTRVQEELGLYNDKPAQAIPAPWREAVKAPKAIEAAAKMLCTRMDYPWDFMPEKGREEMRKNAAAILDAAIAQLSDHTEQHLEMVPAPWREAMKVAREALIDAKTFSGAWPAGAAALAQLDALEGGE